MPTQEKAERGQGEVGVLVASERQFTTHWVPDSGELVLGSGPEADLKVEDPSVAPRHALLQLGERLTLTDLAGQSTTKVRGEPISPGEPTALAANEPFSLGAAMLIVQRRVMPQSRRILTHGYFETRLEEECLRAERFKTAFAVLRVSCGASGAAAELETRLARALRGVDVVGAYGPGEYQVLLCDTSATDAERVLERLKLQLSGVGEVRIGLAAHPRDGRTADALSAAAGERTRDPAPAGRPSLSTMGRLQKLVERVASSTINVLILGETGVGKEQLAQQIHQLSPRAGKPFLGLNGAALSETLLESELFGHERGAFTGAVQAKLGLLEAAEGGTLFLDEAGELPPSIQAKLLRVLETRQVLRVGSVKPRPIDVRFIAATNADLESEVAAGRFRQDLFFRLNGVMLIVPPLRERTEEIPSLARGFAAEACRKYGRAEVPTISEEALALMARYHWPGNIRELRNLVERAVVICEGPRIGTEHLPVEKLSASFASLPPAREPNPSSPRSKEELLADLKAIERQRIVEALAACASNQTRAAKMLGISRRTLVNRMIELGISGPRRRRGNAAGSKGSHDSPEASADPDRRR